MNIVFYSTFKVLQMQNFYYSTKFRNVSRVKLAVYSVYFLGNIADSNRVHRKPRKKSWPAALFLDA